MTPLSALLRLLRDDWRIHSLNRLTRRWKLTRYANEITFVRIPDSWTVPE